MILDGELAYRLLRCFPTPCTWQLRLSESSLPSPSKLETYWGTGVWDELAGRTVLDYGCGTGGDSLEIARRGARRVIGLDIFPMALEVAAKAAERANLAERCTFQTAIGDEVDAIICIDCFEHFADPAAVLRTMASVLRPGGTVFVSFGPPWLHPYGGHSFSVFPWAHLLFTEKSLLRWRSLHCSDGATRFHEVRGGLNQMTVSGFLSLVEKSPLQMMEFAAIPIRPLRLLHNRLTREFFTSIVRCKLTSKRVSTLAAGSVQARCSA
ncbi:MAG TPA: class I SAM-dependent methyltransferase [Gemmataceae bacterium]|jgi:SAM-dependent methyltransferase